MCCPLYQASLAGGWPASVEQVSLCEAPDETSSPFSRPKIWGIPGGSEREDIFSGSVTYSVIEHVYVLAHQISSCKSLELVLHHQLNWKMKIMLEELAIYIKDSIAYRGETT